MNIVRCRRVRIAYVLCNRNRAGVRANSDSTLMIVVPICAFVQWTGLSGQPDVGGKGGGIKSVEIHKSPPILFT